MPAFVLPAALVALIIGAWWKVSHTKTEPISDASLQIFNAALMHLQDPDKLNKLADAFTTAGFTAQAEILRERANLFSLPPAKTAALTALFKQALSSLNPAGVNNTADHFEKQGALACAQELRKYAAGLTAALTTPLPNSPVEGAGGTSAPPLSTLTGPSANQTPTASSPVTPATTPTSPATSPVTPATTPTSPANSPPATPEVTPSTPAGVVQSVETLAQQAASSPLGSAMQQAAEHALGNLT
jgi:hypothetical protein